MITEKCNQWDARFFVLCNLVASWSEDQSRKVGSVIVGEANEVRATGFNGLPRKVSAKIEVRHSRENQEKYLWFEHAERNAIYNVARSGASSNRCRMYISHFPCADCARAIIQSGIVEVNTFPLNTSDDFFVQHYSASIMMFKEAEVKLRFFQRDDSKIVDIFGGFQSLQENAIAKIS